MAAAVRLHGCNGSEPSVDSIHGVNKRWEEVPKAANMTQGNVRQDKDKGEPGDWERENSFHSLRNISSVQYLSCFY